MMQESGILAGTLYVLKYVILIIIPFVEPQLAGILGAIAYLIVRHELNIMDINLKSISTVIFFGWLGAWATVNIIGAHFSDLHHVWVHVASATIGFLSYDIVMMMGKNSTSVIGWIGSLVDIIAKEMIKKWIK